VVLVGWARVRLNDHTVAQVAAGAVVGALIAGVAMPLLAG
jgi:membrane-associated phospholipid phosphatase